MPFFDLSHEFGQKMPTYPGDPKSTLEQAASLAKNGYVDHLVHTTIHVGTHIDAPMHMIPNGKKISDFPVEKFFGRGVLIDARNKKLIDTDILTGVSLKEHDIVLFFTGWDKYFYATDYFESYPVLTDNLAHELVEANISMIGLDSPSPDHSPFSVHKLLLSNEILIIENLTNLEKLLDQKKFEIIALPIKFVADAAMSRVIAKTA